MFYAYVRYLEDNERAVLPVSLIKRFKPCDAGDFDVREVYDAYWIDSEGNGENYFKARIEMVGGKQLPQFTIVSPPFRPLTIYSSCPPMFRDMFLARNLTLSTV